MTGDEGSLERWPGLGPALLTQVPGIVRGHREAQVLREEGSSGSCVRGGHSGRWARKGETGGQWSDGGTQALFQVWPESRQP